VTAAAAAATEKPAAEITLSLSAEASIDAPPVSRAFPLKVVAVVELFMAAALETNVVAVATGLLPVVSMFALRGITVTLCMLLSLNT
jgi:hypothetical protein